MKTSEIMRIIEGYEIKGNIPDIWMKIRKGRIYHTRNCNSVRGWSEFNQGIGYTPDDTPNTKQHVGLGFSPEEVVEHYQRSQIIEGK